MKTFQKISNKMRRKYPQIEGRGQYNKLYPKHLDFGASLRKPYGESSFLRVVRQYKKNAIARQLNFSLDLSTLKKLTKSNCFYCGLVPSQIMKSPDSFGEYIYNGIDRLNPKLGYTKKNCVSSCKSCNKAKSNMNYLEWKNYIKRLVKFQERNNDL